MFAKLWRAVHPVVLWSYPRGSWQYDLLAIAILLFIFLTPRELFRDRPRLPSVQQIEALSGDPDTTVFWVEPFVIDEMGSEELQGKLESLLRQRTGRDLRIVDTRPSTDAEGEVRGYLVYARP